MSNTLVKPLDLIFPLELESSPAEGLDTYTFSYLLLMSY